MSNRRSFIKTLTGIGAITALQDVNLFASPVNALIDSQQPPLSLRFALASDGHYGQPDIDSDKHFSDLVSWINAEHQKQPLDFIIINGDIVHDKPELLKVVKEKYFNKFKIPFYALPGNHDHADTATWKSVFGYEDNYSFIKKEVGFVLANTSNAKGEYICPNENFLKTELDKLKHKTIVFVVLHIPPYQWLPEDTFFITCEPIIKLLHTFPNVKAVFHGHDHNLDNVRYTNKLPHFFDGHFGGNWGTEYKGYRIVEVDQQNKISTYQVNASKNPIINRNKV
ncbi:MAG TPA: metallophosphoesterase [Pedobacter sp.]|jgi:Icc-related predicted phosphoesterase